MRFFKAASAILALSVQVLGQTLTPFQVDGYLDVFVFQTADYSKH